MAATGAGLRALVLRLRRLDDFLARVPRSHGQDDGPPPRRQRHQKGGGHTEFMSDAQEEHPRTNAVRVNESGVLEYFDGERWAPYLDLPDDDPGPLGVVFRGEDR